MQWILCDLDGTLANIDHRRHLVEGKHKNFDLFNMSCMDDTPNQAVMEYLRYAFYSHNVHIVSGREETARELTEKWLSKHQINYDKLTMRPAKDYTPDHELKERWLLDGTLPPVNQILLVLDDRTRVVNMWRKHGIQCFQIADGNF